MSEMLSSVGSVFSISKCCGRIPVIWEVVFMASDVLLDMHLLALQPSSKRPLQQRLSQTREFLAHAWRFLVFVFIKDRFCCEKSICTTDLKRLVELPEGLITLAMVPSKGIKFMSAAVFHETLWMLRTWCTLTLWGVRYPLYRDTT